MRKEDIRVGVCVELKWDNHWREAEVVEIKENTYILQLIRPAGDRIEVSFKDMFRITFAPALINWCDEENEGLYFTVVEYEVYEDIIVDLEIDDSVVWKYFKEKRTDLFEAYYHWTFEETIAWLKEDYHYRDLIEWYEETNECRNRYEETLYGYEPDYYKEWVERCMKED